jgi:hypothetical protein
MGDFEIRSANLPARARGGGDPAKPGAKKRTDQEVGRRGDPAKSGRGPAPTAMDGARRGEARRSQGCEGPARGCKAGLGEWDRGERAPLEVWRRALEPRTDRAPPRAGRSTVELRCAMDGAALGGRRMWDGG